MDDDIDEQKEHIINETEELLELLQVTLFAPDREAADSAFLDEEFRGECKDQIDVILEAIVRLRYREVAVRTVQLARRVK